MKALLSSVSIAMLVFLAPLAQAQRSDLPDFRSIVAETSPAVVKILVEHSGSSARQDMDESEIPEFLRRYFQMPSPPQGRQRVSTGSGFIISADGFIVTNNHVVGEADDVTVRLIDRREFDAEVVGVDPRSDLALLRIDAEDLPYLSLGADHELAVGEWVLAIGSPFGLDFSVTAGIVSAKGRSLPTERNENYVPFIQTDVAINPGNSGGPLFNLRGEVVGVNSQIFTRSGGSIGLSFAIPVSVLRNVVEQLKENGEVTRGWLGVTIQNVDRNLADSFGLDRPRGALVSQLSSGGPAEESGVEVGDVIIEFDGNEIDTSSELPHVVGLIAPGTEVRMKIVRDRKERTIKVTVGGLDADDSPGSAYRDEEGGSGRIGVTVETAPDEMLARWDLSGGVLVRSVDPDSAAGSAGLQTGDVITMVGSTPVRNAEAFRDATEDLQAGDSVPLRVIRRGAPLFIGLRLDD